jgi:hypothetical protein
MPSVMISLWASRPEWMPLVGRADLGECGALPGCAEADETQRVSRARAVVAAVAGEHVGLRAAMRLSMSDSVSPCASPPDAVPAARLTVTPARWCPGPYDTRLRTLWLRPISRSTEVGPFLVSAIVAIKMLVIPSDDTCPVLWIESDTHKRAAGRWRLAVGRNAEIGPTLIAALPKP